MKVRIVCYEATDSWILGKFATNLRNELLKLSVEADIANEPSQKADINHHIIYIDYDGRRTSIDTVMVTHVDADWKFRRLKAQLGNSAAGICMSSDSMRSLAAAGIPPEKLCYINPAHDGLIRPRPLRIGITTRIYPDGRKREGLLVKLAERIDPAVFSFHIMGEGWNAIVATLRNLGFQVDYHPEFNRDVYCGLIASLDYFLYLGQDEGSMGFIDAITAAVPTIVTPQGFHMDAPEGLIHPFNTEGELLDVFDSIASQRKKLTESVTDWTWKEYARKHSDLWNFLLTGSMPESCSYKDGIFSFGIETTAANPVAKAGARFKFIQGSLRRYLCRHR